MCECLKILLDTIEDYIQKNLKHMNRFDRINLFNLKQKVEKLYQYHEQHQDQLLFNRGDYFGYTKDKTD